MKEKFKIKKSFKKECLYTKSNVAWKLILCMILVFIVASFVFGFYLFTKINHDFVFIANDRGGETLGLTKEQLSNTLNYFSEREDKSKNILNSPSPIVDPSR